MSEEDIKLIEDPQDIHLNESRDIQQILGDPPGWILRWGISLVFVAVAVLMLLSYLIKYPDVVTAPVSLTTQNPPIRVFTRTSGKISQLLVEPKQAVKAGQLLAIMENPADPEDVQRLESFMEREGEELTLRQLRKMELPEALELGALQNTFSQLSQDLEELRYLSRSSPVNKTTTALEDQIEELRALNTSLASQKQTLRQVKDLAKQRFERQKKLYLQKLVSAQEVETSEAEYLQNKQQIETKEAEIINNKVRMQQLSLEIIQTVEGRRDQRFPKLYQVQEDWQQLRSELKNWQQIYLIEAPIEGTVEMNRVWSANQFLNTAEELLTIVPVDASNVIQCKGFLPFVGSGKVAEGMTANLRFAAFPFQEFGAVRSRVRSIADVPQNEGYLIELELPQPLVTTYDKAIPFRQEMQGVAMIVTEDRRISDRIFDKILSALKNRNSE
ncbi:MAG: HlyD family efflux transporter periplasmic adaptor subunit [Bacteroidota bacterium]